MYVPPPDGGPDSRYIQWHRYLKTRWTFAVVYIFCGVVAASALFEKQWATAVVFLMITAGAMWVAIRYSRNHSDMKPPRPS